MSSAPARRRPKGPLHPPYRGAPTSGISMSGPQARHGSGALPSSPTEGTDLGLGFLSQQPVTPSRKRNWTPSIQSVSEPYAGQSGWSSSHAPSSSSFGAVAGGVADDPVYAQHAARGYDRDTLTSSFESSSRAWETLNRAQEASQAAQARERQQTLAIASHVQEEPATKKRKGVAGTIVEGAVNTALYAGAAAITAYSLWSSWGRRPSMTEQASAQGQAVSPPTPSKTTLPGGLPDYFPPPPYAEAPISPSASSVGSSIAPNARRAQNVYISRRRRRPVFQSYRNVTVARQMEDGLQTPSTSATSITAPSDIMEAGSSDMDADDDDDEFSRLNKHVSNLHNSAKRHHGGRIK
ncbi:hypothetical protein CBOM_05964 [Ceraceosorus bombacis]|uniref:Uncharacterized protein n=1 Tax=Ceraceosorus bombacis TaxID=401625 RepID=A0A0P1BJJ3_9BASI|nr:hypothetical protein CBOM_05964 [Ceraceosorus bombacis]